MNGTVPTGAALLLDFIYRTETGRAQPECYEVIFGNRQSKLTKPITHMTLGDIQRSQKYWASSKWAARFGSKKFSSATGAPQFMRKTLAELMKEVGLSGAEVFTPDMQDRLAYRLLKRRGYEDWIAGKISRTEFGKRLAMEWASFPVLADCKGAHRSIPRGCSYYEGDKLNKALITPSQVEAVLDHVKAVASAPAQPHSPSPTIPIPGKPEPAPVGQHGGLTLAIAGIAAALVTAWAWAASLPCGWLGFFCN